jgi:hypothetical protein
LGLIPTNSGFFPFFQLRKAVPDITSDEIMAYSFSCDVSVGVIEHFGQEFGWDLRPGWLTWVAANICNSPQSDSISG